MVSDRSRQPRDRILHRVPILLRPGFPRKHCQLQTMDRVDVWSGPAYAMVALLESIALGAKSVAAMQRLAAAWRISKTPWCGKLFRSS